MCNSLLLLTMQGQCKPNAESSLYAEVQPVLAISIAKLRREFEENKKTTEILMKLLRQSPYFATKRGKRFKSCPKRQQNTS
jgi:hypothetical protein